MLRAKTSERFLNGIVAIPGIKRMVIRGPGCCADIPGPSEESCRIQPPDFEPVTIADQTIPMHVLMGDLIIEPHDDEVIEDIAEYCVDFFDGHTFQIMIGEFIKPAPSGSDYIRRSDQFPRSLVGLSDHRNSIAPSYLNQVHEHPLIQS